MMEICKQNILTAQGVYKGKNSDNMLQHKIQQDRQPLTS